MSILDLIYPKRCVECGVFGTYLCSSCFSLISFADADFCAVCQKVAPHGLTHQDCKTKHSIDGVFSSVVYTGVVKKLVSHLKYNPSLLDIRRILSDLFYDGILAQEQVAKLLQQGSIFVPIPLHKNKMQQRGYNQSQVLADALCDRLTNDQIIDRDKQRGFITVVDLLERVKQTKSQFGLSKQSRAENVSGAFVIKQHLLDILKNVETVFLIDDIVSSGATLREAAKVLKKAGVARVYGVAFSHV